MGLDDIWGFLLGIDVGRRVPAGPSGSAWRRIAGSSHVVSGAGTPQCGTRASTARSGDNSTMNIRLNGEDLALDTGSTIAALLTQQGLAGRRVAVEINGDIVPRGRHAEHAIQDGDRVEIVHALGGG